MPWTDDDSLKLPSDTIGFLVMALDQDGQLSPGPGHQWIRLPSLPAKRIGGHACTEDGRAHCNRVGCRKQADCVCGIRGIHYSPITAARWRRTLAERNDTGEVFVLAAVKCSGEVEREPSPRTAAKEIFWASEIQVIALLNPELMEQTSRWRVSLAAERYQIPVCRNRRQLAASARRHGRPVPLRIRPGGVAGQLAHAYASAGLPQFRRWAGIARRAGLLTALGVLTVAGLPLLTLAATALSVCYLIAVLPAVLRGLIDRRRHATLSGETFCGWHHPDRNPSSQEPAATDPKPHYPHTVIGYRRWHLRPGGKLVPLGSFMWGEWTPGRNTAVCRRPSPADHHQSPGEICHCGFNAFDWVSDVEHAYDRGSDLITGAIIAGGDVRAHYLGFRAEHAAVVALLEPRTPELADRARAAAARYRVPLVRTRRQLAQAARATGAEPMTRQLRPRPTLKMLTGLVAAEIPRPLWIWLPRVATFQQVGLLALAALITVAGLPVIAIGLLAVSVTLSLARFPFCCQRILELCWTARA